MLSRETKKMIKDNKMPVRVLVAKDEEQWYRWLDKGHAANVVREELEMAIEIYSEQIEELGSDEHIHARDPYFSKHIDSFRKIANERIENIRKKLDAAEKLMRQMEGVPDDVWLHGDSLKDGEIVVFTYTSRDGYMF